MVKDLDIKDVAQVQHISELAADAPYEVWLSSGPVMLDARSLLGLYALVGKRVQVVAEDDVDPSRFFKLVSKMAR